MRVQELIKFSRFIDGLCVILVASLAGLPCAAQHLPVPNRHFRNEDVRIPNAIVAGYSDSVQWLLAKSRMDGRAAVAPLGFRVHPEGWIVDVGIVSFDYQQTDQLRSSILLVLQPERPLFGVLDALGEKDETIMIIGGGPQAYGAFGFSVLDWEAWDAECVDRVVYIQPVPLRSWMPGWRGRITRMRLKEMDC